MLNYEPEQSAEISDTLKSEQTYTAGSFFLIKLLPNKIAIVFVFLLALILVSLCAFFSFDYTHACAHTHDTLAPMNHFNFLPQLNSSIFLCTLLLPYHKTWLLHQNAKNWRFYDFDVILHLLFADVIFLKNKS